MDTLNEVLSEDKERAKMYLETALKILGLGQIVAGSADMFLNGGFNFTMFNSVIVVTGLIFFLGSSALKEPLRRLLYMEKKEEEILKFDSQHEIHYAKEDIKEEYRIKKEQEFYEKYKDLLR